MAGSFRLHNSSNDFGVAQWLGINTEKSRRVAIALVTGCGDAVDVEVVLCRPSGRCSSLRLEKLLLLRWCSDFCDALQLAMSYCSSGLLGGCKPRPEAWPHGSVWPPNWQVQSRSSALLEDFLHARWSPKCEVQSRFNVL